MKLRPLGRPLFEIRDRQLRCRSMVPIDRDDSIGHGRQRRHVLRRISTALRIRETDTRGAEKHGHVDQFTPGRLRPTKRHELLRDIGRQHGTGGVRRKS